MQLDNLRLLDLLTLYGRVMGELRRRGALRSSNGPIGDYGELLFATAFGWSLERNSASGFDAVDQAGIRYQIKCRRLAAQNKSRQLSAIRRLELRPFDILAGLLFRDDFTVFRAALIPVELVAERATYSAHVNAHRFLLQDAVWLDPRVRDVTPEIAKTQQQL